MVNIPVHACRIRRNRIAPIPGFVSFVIRQKFRNKLVINWLSPAECSAVRDVINDFHSRPNTTGIQSNVYKAIVKATGSPWHDLINRRLYVLSPTEVPFDFASVQDSFCNAAKRVGPGIMMTVIKSILNSWVTSHRFHEDVQLHRIFGCEGCRDTLSHYLVCDPFWTLLICT